ncbi:MAG: thioesterase family protein [Myxococcota bacterium]
MARDDATSVHEVQVRFAETDLMGIVHHATYLLYCEAARVDWLHKRGVSYQSWVSHGIHLAVVESQLRYRAPAHFDDLLAVETRVDAMTRVTVTYRYRIRRAETLLCEAHTLLACVGNDMKLKRIPPAVRDVLESAELPADRWAPRLG